MKVNLKSQIPRYKQTTNHISQTGGFTLIELLVSISIVVLISGASLAAFINYLERSQAQSDASAVANRLRMVQIKATAVEVPGACASVTSYTASLANSNLTVVANCPGAGSVALTNLSLTLAKSSFSSNTSITFYSRNVSASPLTVGVCGNNHLFEITINEGANVSRPVYVGGC